MQSLNESLSLIANALNVANQRGLFNLNESVQIHEALTVITKELQPAINGVNTDTGNTTKSNTGKGRTK